MEKWGAKTYQGIQGLTKNDDMVNKYISDWFQASLRRSRQEGWH